MRLEMINPFRLFQRAVSSALPLIDALFVAKARNKHQRQKKICEDHSVRINIEPKQLLIDVSIISQNDAQTGIQRVVRALASQLLGHQALDGYVVRTVAATRRSPYRIIDGPGQPVTGIPPREITIQPGDIFLGLDLCTRIVPAQQKQLAAWQRSGASLNFVVYDLLPLQNPQWFPEKTVAYFQRWLRSLAILADQIICISPLVAREFNAYTMDRYRLPEQWVLVCTIPMGHDIAASQPSQGLPEGFPETLAKIKNQNALLIVGTLEPRKGHEQVLGALEHLWKTGKDFSLVIVGRPGWKTESLQQQLKAHPERMHRLFWFDNASDEALDHLYRACHGVLIASWAEGFGLPLIEAQGYGKPILARNLAVFREQARPGVSYFEAQTVTELANAIEAWHLRISRSDHETQNTNQDTPTWENAACDLWRLLSHQATEHKSAASWPKTNTLRVVN